MPWFHYKAVSASGEVLEGELEASDRQAVVEELRRLGHVPIRAEARRGRGVAGRRVRVSGRGRVSGRQVAFLTQELAILLGAGLPLDRALSMLAGLSDAGPLRRLVERLLERVRGGGSLSQALESEGDAFPSYYAGMVRAGEAGGSLETILERLSEMMERSEALRESVISALIYPALVVVVAVASLAVLMTAVIPEFRPLFEEAGAGLPWIAGAVLWSSDVARAFWWLPLVLFLVVVWAVSRLRAEEEGRLRLDRWVLGLPLAGSLVMKLEVARLTRTLGTLMSNGVSVLNAVSMTVGALGNRAVAAELSELRGRLAKGEGLAGPLSELGIFPRLAVQLIEIGEESGRLEVMLLRVAEIYDEELRRGLERFLALLVPVVTVLMGLVIAVIIGSMLAAILSAYELPF